MARYPLPTDVNWSIGLQEVPKYVNTVTHGIVMNLILLAIALIVGSSYWFTKRDLPASLAVGCFVTWVFGFLLWLGDLLGSFNFAILTAITITSVIYVIISTNQQ